MLASYYPLRRRSLFDNLFDFEPEFTFFSTPQRYFEHETEEDFKFEFIENDNGYSIETHGSKDIDTKDVGLKIHNNDDGSKTLEVELSKEDEWESEDGQSFRKYHTTTKKLFKLDSNADLEKVKAVVKEGKLVVDIPYKEKIEEKEKYVEIPIEFVEKEDKKEETEEEKVEDEKVDVTEEKETEFTTEEN